MDENKFYDIMGYFPANDDLDRINCKEQGQMGHWLCGWCDKHNKPRFTCGCRLKINPDLPTIDE